MALKFYVEATANGVAIEPELGENTRTNLAGVDIAGHLEGLQYEAAVEVPMEGASGVHATGHRQMKPDVFLFRAGKSAPLWRKALRLNENVELTAKFFRNAPEGGETENHFNVTLTGARVCKVRMVVPNVLDTENGGLPHMLEVHVLAHTREEESVTGGTSDIDDWANPDG